MEILRKRIFSVIPDKTTDVSTKSQIRSDSDTNGHLTQLAICVMYFDEETLKPVTSFLAMVEVKDSTAKGLYTALETVFAERRLPMSNIIGYASDTCNTMFGQHNSVSTLLKSEVPHVLLVKCSCHMIHLYASHACQKMSKSLEEEDTCRQIYNHFNTPYLRQQDLLEFQMFVGVKPHKLLKIGQTRWLSLESCVERVLEQWDALQL